MGKTWNGLITIEGLWARNVISPEVTARVYAPVALFTLITPFAARNIISALVPLGIFRDELGTHKLGVGPFEFLEAGDLSHHGSELIDRALQLLSWNGARFVFHKTSRVRET